MMRTVLFFPIALIRLILVLAVTLIVALSGLVWYLLFGFSRSLQRRSMQIWGRTILAICGILIQRNEVPDCSRFILMPNHRSYIDIFIFSALTPAAFVAKAELKNWPMMRSGAKISNLIFVSRSDLQSLVSTMNKIKNTVKQNIPVIIFPEGTTSQGPLTSAFKKGSFKIAAETGIPVIPAAIHYKDTKDAWIGNDNFPGHFLRQMGKPVTRVSLRFGKPIINTDYQQLLFITKESIDEMLKQIIP